MKIQTPGVTQKKKGAELSPPNYSEENLGYFRVLMIATLLYPVWWITSWKYSHEFLHLDPLANRIGVALISVVFFLLTYTHRVFRRFAYPLSLFGHMLVAAQYMNVVRLNELAPMRIFGMFQIISVIFVTISTLRGVLVFGGWMVGLSLWVAQTPSVFPGKVLAPGMALLTALMYFSLRVRVKLINRLTESRKAIRDILDNVPSGFLTFDRSGRIGSNVSKATTGLFNTASLENKSFAEVCGLSAKETESVFKPFLEVLFDGTLPPEDAIRLAPASVETSMGPDKGSRYIELEYHPTYARRPGDDSEKMDQVIVVANDRTQERRLRQEVARQQDRILAIAKILEKKKEFHQLLRGVRDLTDHPPSSLSELARAIHTQKGFLQAFRLSEVAQVAHQLEDKLKLESASNPERLSEASADTISSNPSSFLTYLRDDLNEYRRALEDFVSEHKEVLGMSKDTEELSPSLTLTRNEGLLLLKTIQNDLSSSPTETKNRILRRLARSLLWEDPFTSLRGLEDPINFLAERQGKAVKLHWKAQDDLRIHLTPYSSLFESFIHAFRNSVDHGIETRSQRREKGKAEEGKLICAISLDPGKSLLRITIQDDGAGVDLTSLKKSIIEKGLESAERLERLPEEELLKFLFRPGFSTRRSVSEISGRGIGLDAVHAEVLRLKGSVTLRNEKDRGLLLEIEVPYDDGLSSL
jgi:two-component system chemotaxis sensor kinase CheA